MVQRTIWGDFGLPDGIWIYGGIAPMSNVPVPKEAPGRDTRPGADTPLAPRRPGYSLVGCFPAEPASASPGRGIAADCDISLQPLDIGEMPWKSTPVIGNPPK